MREFFDEVVTVVAYSRKTQVALVLGPVSFFTIRLLEARFVGGLELTGPMAPLTESVKAVFHERYDKIALGSLLAFWILAWKCYRRDRKMLW